MFTVAKTHRFWWPVKVVKPDPDKAGAFREEEFKARFEAVSDEAAETLNKDALARGLSAVQQTRAFLAAAVCDWSDVTDENGAAVGFSSQILQQSLGLTWVRDGFIRAYSDAVNGKAQVGN